MDEAMVLCYCMVNLTCTFLMQELHTDPERAYYHDTGGHHAAIVVVR